MAALPRISDAEWTIMKVLWANAPLTAEEIVATLQDFTTWNPRTIKTLLNRLVKKQALGYEKDGRRYYYAPLVDEAECMRAESQSFLARVYDGAFSPMLAMFLEDNTLSPEEIAELRRMLNQQKKA